MDRHGRPLALVFVSALAFALMGADYNALPSGVPALPASPGSASIYNPGSGDFAGFRIVVAPSGKAIAVDGAGRAQSMLQPDIVSKFFADLAAAGPLGALAASRCTAASPSEATPTVEVITPLTIGWRGQHTQPLACVGDPRAVKLLLDATTIQRALYVQAYRKRSTLAYGVYGYGGTVGYGAGGYGAGYGAGGSGFYFEPYSNGSFSAGRFSASGFQMDRFSMTPFDNGYRSSGLPWSSGNFTSPSFTSLPYATLPSASYTTSLQIANPYAASPFSGGPMGTSPYGSSFSSGLPTASGPTIVTHP